MTDAPVRHLVRDLHVRDGRNLADLACVDGLVPCDRDRHTLVAPHATCPDCLAVHAAYLATF